MSDIGTIAQKVGTLLKARGETIAVAESSSGGLISAALLAVPGASAYFKGGSTVYTGSAKRILMEVSADVMEANRPATQAHALDLARAAKAPPLRRGECSSTTAIVARHGFRTAHSGDDRPQRQLQTIHTKLDITYRRKS